MKTLSIIKIISKYDYLKKAFKYIILNNKSNGAPYHNLNHLLTVTKGVYDGMQFEGLGKDKRIKEMLLTAIFHDFNHSAGKKTDDKNIAEAKKSLRKFLKEEKIEADIVFMEKILDATQYPYVLEVKDLDIYQKIVRDADIIQNFMENWIHQSVFGISQELNLNFISFIQNHKKFFATMKFNTAWGKQLKKDNYKRIVKETELLEDVCK